MAAAPSSFVGAQFHEELSCSICLELFTRPKVLPCQHTFCQDCLQDHFGGKLRIRCPNCRLKVWLPPQGVTGLPDNHIVANMCDKLQQEATLLEESGNRCSLHPTEEVRLYCKQCRVPVCNECLDEMHSDHGTISLKKAIEQTKAPVQALIVEVKNILVTYCSFVKSLKDKKEALEEEKQETDNSINQTYNQMVQKLTENRDHLLSKVSNNHKKNITALTKETFRVLADVIELSVACDQAEQEMEWGGVEFLSQQTALTEVVGKHRGKAAPTPVQTQPAVFQPTDTPVPVLGHVTVRRVTGQWQGKTIKLGVKGSKTDKLYGPAGVTVSGQGEIFVADRGNQTIQVYTMQGEFVRKFPTVLPSSFLLSLFLPSFQSQTSMCPRNVALDGEGNLWVVGDTEDNAEFAVQYNKQGRALRKIDLMPVANDRHIAVDTRRNHILITGNSSTEGEVLVFRPDGTLVRTVSQMQGMKNPSALTVDREGNILVLSLFGRDNIDVDCVFMDSEEGQFLFHFDNEIDYSEDVNTHVLCKFSEDAACNIFVAKCSGCSIYIHDKTGRFRRHIPTGLCLLEPHSLATGPLGELVVTDPPQNAIHIIHRCK